MNISAVLPGYLYSADTIFPAELINLINMINWAERAYTRLDIGRGHRRQVIYNIEQDTAVNDYCFDVVKPLIEQECHVKFLKDAPHSFTYWLDEPGFKPSIHIDGDLPSSLQIYLQADNRTDLGTAFYRTQSRTDVIKEFKSIPNTGYIMFNQPEANRPELWHDMTRRVPEGVLRLCLYLTFGNYERISS